MPQSHVFTHKTKNLSLLNHRVFYYVYLIGNHRHNLSCQPVYLVQTKPTTCITQPWKQLVKSSDVDLTRTVENHTILGHAPPEFFETFCFACPWRTLQQNPVAIFEIAQNWSMSPSDIWSIDHEIPESLVLSPPSVFRPHSLHNNRILFVVIPQEWIPLKIEDRVHLLSFQFVNIVEEK